LKGVKAMKIKVSDLLFFTFLILGSFFSVSAQNENKSSADLYKEVQNYPRTRMNDLRSKGVTITRDKSEGVMKEKRVLAEKSAKELAGRSGLIPNDVFYLGLLYEEADDEKNAMTTFQKYIANFPKETKNEALQSARQRVVIYASKNKELEIMEKTFADWSQGEPITDEQHASLQDYMTLAYYKDKNYDQAIKYGENALKLTEKLPEKDWRQRKNKETIYGNLVELLTYSYKKNDRKEDAVSILAQGRALSFTIPSAELYRRVMQIVSASGVSEKKLMEKVQSISSAEPAPELEITEWLGQSPVKLEQLRGKVVLLDFWATWCGPCISTFPRLRSWHKKYSDDGFMIIGVTRYWGKDGGKSLTPLQEYDFLGTFKEKHKLPYGFAVSDGDKTLNKFGVGAYPTTILLDRKGVVRYIGIGAGAEEVENLEDMIKKVIKEENLAN
jgi:thiol-disulfide isomerase/thioredoxin